MAGRRRQSAANGNEEMLRDLLEHSQLRAKSLIVSIYGDAIAPHGGTVWLGSLIDLVRPFGLNERLVRTAVLRLSRDDWLASQQIGRRSYYSLTESGRRRFEDAYRRIYALSHDPWDGAWTLVLSGAGDLAGEARTRLQRELSWQGFGALAPGLLAHPAADAEALRHVLQDCDPDDQAVIMSARTEDLPGAQKLSRLVASCWDLAQVAADYQEFLDRFRPVWRALESAAALDPAFCFAIRTLLIHEYRRVLLRDPQLPEELLPADWAGAAARGLCRNLYRRTVGPAERHLLAVLRTADGPLPEAAAYFYARFGGLPRDGEADLRQAG